jgi:hypothetical protein
MKYRFIVFFVSLILSSCASPEKDWQLAERDDSQNAYLEFLAKHPDSEFAEHARRRINELKVLNAWERAKFKDTLDAYEAFISKYDDSEFVADARERVREIQRDDHWERIQTNDDKTAIEAFLEEYPDAPQQEEARSILTTIAEAEEAARPNERPGNFRLQLAAFRTAAAAEQELRRLVTLAPEILIGHVRIEMPNQGNEGNMFLLKSVPMTGAEARDACTALKNIGQSCLIINR